MRPKNMARQSPMLTKTMDATMRATPAGTLALPAPCGWKAAYARAKWS